MINYLIKAALLEKSVYSIFKKSPEMVLYSLVTVSLTGLSLAAALKYTTDNTGTESYLMIMVAFSTIMVGWMMWSFVAKVICQVLGSESEFRDMMRSTGIAYSPGILSIFISIGKVNSTIGLFVVLVVWVWVLLSVTRSIQSTQEISFWKSLIPGVTGWFMAWIVFIPLMLGNYFL